MNALLDLSQNQRRSVTCCVAAAGAVRLTPTDLAELRKAPARLSPSLQPAFLKHADEQTIASLAAVYAALRQWQEMPSLDTWGVIAGPRYMGRVGVAHTIQRFMDEGAWGVSPHMIPHRSLHSVSGTISQALALHGPNCGVSSGPDAAGDALLAATALITTGSTPGTWVVVSGWSPEVTLPAPGQAMTGLCSAAALALMPALSSASGAQLHLGIGPRTSEENPPKLTAETLADCILDAATDTTRRWRLGCYGWMELKPVIRTAESHS